MFPNFFTLLLVVCIAALSTGFRYRRRPEPSAPGLISKVRTWSSLKTPDIENTYGHKTRNEFDIIHEARMSHQNSKPSGAALNNQNKKRFTKVKGRSTLFNTPSYTNNKFGLTEKTSIGSQSNRQRKMAISPWQTRGGKPSIVWGGSRQHVPDYVY